MKCAMLKDKRKIELESISEPKSKDGSVIIDVKKCGICGSDIHYWDLGLPNNLVMGHEFCGIVVDPGCRSDLAVGDRVTSLPISPCGECPACKSGNPQYCPKTWDTAVGLSLTNPGAYAESTSLRPDLTIKVPSNITDAEVAMVEPTAVSLHAVNLADVKIGSRVLVIGAGIIGQLCAMFAKLNGASYVAVSETNEKRGKKCVALRCADEFFNARDEKFMENITKENAYGFDVVFDCSGNSAAVSTGIALTRPNGTLVMVGVSMDSITIPSILVVTKELKVFGAIAYTVDEFKECINLMSERKIDVLKFVDDIVGLNKVQEAFERLTSGEDNAIKILIDPKK
jgi:2-desacetyl-2-hydroxyethyl bacteriochlorophyllide A dehydrogenase